MTRSLVRRLAGTVARNQAPIGFTSKRTRISLPFVHRSDLETQMAAMGAVGVLFAIVDRSATSTSQIRWHLYRTAKSGKDEDRIEATAHPALTVWNRPNNYTTRQELIEAGQQHADLTGETWLVVGRHPASDLPLELWNVRPDRMAPKPDPDDFISGYIYTSPDGEEVPLKKNQVIFQRRPNPLDPYRGMGPVQTVLNHIDGERYSAEWNRNFFLNGAEPGGIIEVEKRLSEVEFDEMTERWQEQHKGVRNAHRVALLENGAKWVDRKFTQRDMQFTQLSVLSGEKIREAFGFPKPMLGSVDDINRANAEAGEYVFARWLIVHRLERWKQALNNDFLPMFGSLGVGYEFDYESPVPVDRTADNDERDSKAKAAEIMIGLGFAPADVLAWLELPDLPYSAPPVLGPPPGSGGAGPSADGTTTAMLLKILDQVTTWDAMPRTVPREHHDGHGGHGDPGDEDPWRARAVAQPPDPPPDIRPELPEGAGPDLDEVQQSWSTALDNLLRGWADLAEGYRDRIIDAVMYQLQGGNVIGLSAVTLSTADGAALLEDAMLQLGADAAAQVVEEAKRQGIEDGALTASTLDRTRTAATAQTFASLLGKILVGSAVGEALRIWRPGAVADDIRERLVTHLGSLTDAAPRQYLGNALTQAQREGRLLTATSGPVAALYADEVLDSNICTNCRSVNRKWLGNSDDVSRPWELTYPTGGYIDCLGRFRCRGQVVFVWRGGKDWTKWVELPEQRTAP